MTDDRAAAMRAFLDARGWGGVEPALLAADASFRRYFRLTAGNGERAVLMDAPPGREDVRPFRDLAEHLGHLGFSAPEILADDETRGFLLLEDLGDATYTRLIREGADEAALYRLATEVLIALHSLPEARAVPEGLPPYDRARFLDEAALFIDWYLPAVTGRNATPDARADFFAAWDQVLPAVEAVPRSLVLRDYHVDNLMHLPGREGVAACGLLDFQDGVAGPALYDLMSLLEDARRDVPREIVDRERARYLAAFPALDRGAFDAAWAVLAAQRHTKVLGIFTRLCARDGKPGYLQHVPRLWRLLDNALNHPALDPVRRWLDAACPPERRGVPECPCPTSP